jgi:biotin operon repressor
MARRYSKDVLSYLQANPGKPLGVTGLAKKLDLDEAQVRNAMNYLRTPGVPIEVLKPGRLWRYGHDQRTIKNPFEGVPAEPNGPARINSQETLEKWLGAEAESVPASEPTITLRVLGTLKETGEVLVVGDLDDLESGVWALRKLG